MVTGDTMADELRTPPLRLHFEAVDAIAGHVYARILKAQPDSVQPIMCGTMFLTMPEWLVLCKILAAATSTEFEFTHRMDTRKCDKCGEEISRITCPLCLSQMCEACWSDHPHAYGIHIEGSTK